MESKEGGTLSALVHAPWRSSTDERRRCDGWKTWIDSSILNSLLLRVIAGIEEEEVGWWQVSIMDDEMLLVDFRVGRKGTEGNGRTRKLRMCGRMECDDGIRTVHPMVAMGGGQENPQTGSKPTRSIVVNPYRLRRLRCLTS
jgi:hypothetical protein